MYGYFTEEARRDGCQKTAAAHRAAAALFPVVRKVFEQFDEKVFNCRLEKALQEASKDCRVYVRKYDYAIEIYAYFDDYRGNNQYTLARLKTEELTDGKRIPAAVLVESARGYREDHLKEAAAREAAPETAPDIREHVKYFISQANKLIESLPYPVQDMYGLSKVHSY